MAIQCPKCQNENADDSVYCAKCAAPLTAAEGIQPSFTKTLLTPVEDLAQGTIFAGRYKILEELGKGGMGKVYKALDSEIHEEVAIKLLKPEVAADEEMLERFRNELKIARKISHKNVCRMYHISKEEGTPYITMEFVRGEDLKGLLKKKAVLEKGEALAIAKQVCEGLVEAHKLGVVHRDLKPQNIMIDDQGNAKIMDFGIARSLEAPGVTQTGMIIGTPDYISPEQAEGREADHRSDIYSFAVILYEMVTGDVPFKGDTALSVALKHKSQLPLDPRKFNPEVSDDLARLILICMEKDRARRYQTAEALLDDLRNVEEGFPLGTKVRPRRATFVSALIRNKLFIPAMAIALAIVAIAIWQLLPKNGVVYPPKTENSIAVISFKNQTGDEAWNMYQQVIPNYLITSLEQTGLFQEVATWERLRDLLKQMDKGDVEIITSDMGFEACKRNGIQALVLGTYTKIGETFATDVKVLDVDTKRLLKTASSRGKGEDSILDQIDDLSKQISEGMGVSVQKIEESYTSIEDLTTNSPEAYNYYIRGVEEDSKLHGQEALRFLEKAIELDPDFAMAYYRLGTGFFWGATLPTARIEYIKKAKSLSDRVSDKEKLMIERAYARSVEGNREKADDILKLLLEKYPKEKEFHLAQALVYSGQGLIDKSLEEFDRVIELDPHYGWGLIRLAGIHMRLEDFEKALEYAKRAVSACPGDPNPLDTMGQVYLYMGDLENALIKYREAMEAKPDWLSEEAIAYIYALKENYPETLRWIDSYIAKAPTIPIKAYAYWWKGFYYAWRGNRARSFECLDKVAELLADESGGWLNPRHYAEWLKGCIYLDRGDHESARKHFQIFLDSQPSVSGHWRNILQSFLLGLLDVREGNINSAKSRLREMEPILQEMLSPTQKKYTKYYYEFLNAEVYLSEHPVDEAIAASINDSMARIPVWGNIFSADIAWYNFPFQKDMIARAYLRKGDLDKAIDWYEQHIVISPMDNDRRLIPPKYHYKLAVLYEEKGKRSKAIAQYEKFLDLWKDADPGLPEVEDARKRLEGLRGS